MDVLETIAKLRAALKPDTTIEETKTWWDQYMSIESDLDFDPRTSKYERDQLQRLKDGLSQAILRGREGTAYPDFHRAHITLTALEQSIQRRTAGPDGWPLRR